jgi:hypothetical protein
LGFFEGTLEKPQEMPYNMFCPRQKNYFKDPKSEVHWYFYVPNREKERERERGRARVRARARARAGKGKGKRKGQGKGQGKGKRKGKERERECRKALAILFLNRLGHSEQFTNYTVLYRKEWYSMYS